MTGALDIIAKGMTEDDLLTGVMQLLTLRRWLWTHSRRSDRAILQGDPGFPDIIAVRPPRLLAIELKSARGRVGPMQPEWLDRLQKSGAESYVWRPTDWLSGEIERVLE
jgi:hypothetical protein